MCSKIIQKHKVAGKDFKKLNCFHQNCNAIVCDECAPQAKILTNIQKISIFFKEKWPFWLTFSKKSKKIRFFSQIGLRIGGVNAGYIRKSSPKSAYIIGDFFGQNGLRIGGGLMLGGGVIRDVALVVTIHNMYPTAAKNSWK